MTKSCQKASKTKIKSTFLARARDS